MTSILVVDDDPAIRRTLTVALRARGFEVHTVATGRDALASLDALAADLVLLDLGLPDMDGLSVLATLRSHAQVPVIVLSGRTGSKDKIDAPDQGAEDFVPKHFDIEEGTAQGLPRSSAKCINGPVQTTRRRCWRSRALMSNPELDLYGRSDCRSWMSSRSWTVGSTA